VLEALCAEMELIVEKELEKKISGEKHLIIDKNHTLMTYAPAMGRKITMMS
jgi:hypothetical protein